MIIHHVFAVQNMFHGSNFCMCRCVRSSQRCVLPPTSLLFNLPYVGETLFLPLRILCLPLRMDALLPQIALSHILLIPWLEGLRSCRRATLSRVALDSLKKLSRLLLCVVPNKPFLQPSIGRWNIVAALDNGCTFAPDRVIAYSSHSLTRRLPFMPESNTFTGSSWLFEETIALSSPAMIFVHAHKGWPEGWSLRKNSVWMWMLTARASRPTTDTVRKGHSIEFNFSLRLPHMLFSAWLQLYFGHISTAVAIFWCDSGNGFFSKCEDLFMQSSNWTVSTAACCYGFSPWNMECMLVSKCAGLFMLSSKWTVSTGACW